MTLNELHSWNTHLPYSLSCLKLSKPSWQYVHLPLVPSCTPITWAPETIPSLQSMSKVCFPQSPCCWKCSTNTPHNHLWGKFYYHPPFRDERNRGTERSSNLPRSHSSTKQQRFEHKKSDSSLLRWTLAIHPGAGGKSEWYPRAVKILIKPCSPLLGPSCVCGRFYQVRTCITQTWYFPPWLLVLSLISSAYNALCSLSPSLFHPSREGLSNMDVLPATCGYSTWKGLLCNEMCCKHQMRTTFWRLSMGIK